jgi:hypothetical protein
MKLLNYGVNRILILINIKYMSINNLSIDW